MALIACLMVLMACVMDCIARMLASFGMCYRLQGFVCVGGLRSGLNGSRYGLICCAWRYFICLGFGMCLWFGLFLCLIGCVWCSCVWLFLECICVRVRVGIRVRL